MASAPSNEDDDVTVKLTEDQLDELSRAVSEAIPVQRKHATKQFAPLLKSDDDHLTRQYVRKLTPAGSHILSIKPCDLTHEDFEGLPRIVPERFNITPSTRTSGSYVLLAVGKDGWAMKVGSSTVMEWRLFSHMMLVVNAQDDGGTDFYAMCKRLGAMPEMIQIATEDPEPDLGAMEFNESVTMVLLDTFQSAHKRFQRQLESVQSLRVDGYQEPTFTGCNRALPVAQPLTALRKSAGQAEEIECRTCNLPIALDDYTEHLDTQHNDREPPITCPTCARGFDLQDIALTVKKYHAHVISCGKFACSDCDSSFRRPQDYIDHYKWRHTDEKLYVCETCGEAKRNLQDLDRHGEVHVPPDLKPLKCDACPKRFAVITNLREHERFHRDKASGRFICDECGEQFAEAWILKRHSKTKKGCEMYIMQQYRTGMTRSAPSQKYPDAIGYEHWCYAYPGCGNVNLQIGQHITQAHPHCQYCHIVFPHVRLPDSQKSHATPEQKMLHEVIRQHERICPKRDSPVEKPLATKALPATVDNVLVDIPAKLRQFFVGTPDFATRNPMLATVKNLALSVMQRSKLALRRAKSDAADDTEEVSSSETQSLTVEKTESRVLEDTPSKPKPQKMASKSRVDKDKMRTPLAELDPNSPPPKKKAKTMTQWLGVTDPQPNGPAKKSKPRSKASIAPKKKFDMDGWFSKEER